MHLLETRMARWKCNEEQSSPSVEPAVSLRPYRHRSHVVAGGLLLLAVAGTLLFTRLDYPLLEPDEGRFAIIPLQMITTGEYLVPALRGQSYNQKPPLAYWLVAAGYHLFGVHDWMPRAVSALAALACIMTIFFWSSRQLGLSAGLWSGLLLSTMAGFVGIGRMMLVDSVFSCFLVLALGLGQVAVAGAKVRLSWWLASAACCGLAVLTKGPAALVLVVPPLLCQRWLDKGCARWRLGHVLAYLLPAAAVAGPWYLLMLERNPVFFEEFLVQGNVQRFLRPIHHPGQPFWYYVPTLFAELLPWPGLFLFCLAAVWRKNERTDLPGAVRLCLAGSVWVFVFFSASAGKLPTYLMPMLPLAAVVMGYHVQELLRAPAASSWERWFRKPGPLWLTVLLLASLCGWGCWEHVQHPDRQAPLWALGTGIVGMAALLVFRNHLGPRGAWQACLAAAAAGIAFAGWFAVSSFITKMATGPVASRVASDHEQAGWTVATYSSTWHAAAFYRGGRELPAWNLLDGPELQRNLENSSRVLILLRRNAWEQFEKLKQHLPASRQISRVEHDGPVMVVQITPGQGR